MPCYPYLHTEKGTLEKKTEGRYFKETKLKVETKLTATSQKSLKQCEMKERVINTNQLNFHQASIRS